MMLRPKLPNYEFLRFKKAISIKRLNAYKKHTSDDDLDLLSTYLWNIALSEALYPVFHNFEVALRNSFHHTIARSFGEDWLYKTDSKLLNIKEKETVKCAIENLKKKGQNISSDNLISELSLGFWVSLSFATYEGKDKLYPKLFKDKEFLPDLPTTKRTRKTLSSQLNSICKLRNRIFHHKPIWNERNLKQEYDNTLEVIQWISPILYEMTKTTSRFPEIYLQERTTYSKILEKVIPNTES